MKQNKEVREGKLCIRSRKFNLCCYYVTELNSYLKLFPQLWMDPKCHCYQSCTLKKTADNMPGKTGNLSRENVSHFHPLTLLSLSISKCHKSLLADKLHWYKPTASGSTRERCHSLSARDCEPCSSQADCTCGWLRDRGRETAIRRYRLNSPVCLSAAPVSKRETLKYPRKQGGVSAHACLLSPVSPTNTFITVWGSNWTLQHWTPSIITMKCLLFQYSNWYL